METAVTYNKHEIYNILRDYFWMINQIKKLNSDLKGTDFKGVAQYGVTATLPSGKGIVSKALENEVVRRNEKSERLVDYAQKVNFINDNRHKVKVERELVVLDCLLDGMSIAAIARHLGTGRRQINEIRDKIVGHLAE